MAVKKRDYTRIFAPKLNIEELTEEGAFFYNDEPDIIYVEAKAKGDGDIPCPVCGSFHTKRNGWAKSRYIHDISQGVKKIDILLHVDRFRCLEPQCGGTFSRRFEFVEENHTLTKRLVEVIKRDAREQSFRSIAEEYGIPTDFYKTKDIHIHFPEGAVPKDGPSAGVTMVTALVSALTCRPVRRDVAMTGEISLRGNVLAIGGLKEKTMAAYSAGVKTVLIPADNQRDLDDIDVTARASLKFVPCKKASDVLAAALCPAITKRGEEVEETTEIEIVAPANIGADEIKIPALR